MSAASSAAPDINRPILAMMSGAMAPDVKSA